MKKLTAILLVAVLLCGTLFGCGAKSTASDGAMRDEMLMEGSGSGVTEDAALQSTTQNQQTAVNSNQKLVRKVWLDAETEDMDSLLGGITQQVAALEGYVEARNVYNGSQYSGRRYRNASLTVRIPADRLDQFVQHVSENANITNNRETADDITLAYSDTESRITALQTEQTRLLALLESAETMADLLEIEKRLTDVRTELEQVTSQLRLYDNQVSYGTVYLSVNEVKEYTVTEEPETVWERIGAGFVESLKNLGKFFTELFVIVVVGLPYLVLIGILVTAVILAIKFGKKKKKAKKEPEA